MEHTVEHTMNRSGLALHWQILIGMAAGLIAGLVVNLAGDSIDSVMAGGGALAGAFSFIARLNDFIGDLFLRGLRFIAVPIVLFSLIVGASSLNDLKSSRASAGEPSPSTW